MRKALQTRMHQMKRNLTRGGAWLIAVITALALVLSVSLTQPAYADEQTSAATEITTEASTDLTDDLEEADGELLNTETVEAEEAETQAVEETEAIKLDESEKDSLVTTNDTIEINDATYTITANGTYHVADGLTCAITISKDATAVTIVGNGIKYDSDVSSENYGKIDDACKANAITIDASASAGINLTLKDLYNSVGTSGANLINFSGTGNVLTIKGIVLMDYDVGYTSEKDALIHVGPTASLTIDGDGTYYQYNCTQGAGIGGDTGEMNGIINFSMTGAAFIKGTRQGAVIGAGAKANGTGTPGAITFNSGEYNIITNSRGAAIGGSAGSGGASEGTSVYVKGGTVSINSDFSGAAVGGGGYDKGNDASGGTLYMTGGSLRTYVDTNAVNNAGWKGETVTEAGVSDVIITAQRKDAAGNNLYYCTVPAGEVAADDNGAYTIKVDGNDYYIGKLHRYSFFAEGVDRDQQWNTDPVSTIGNWILDTSDKKDTNAYLFLTGENHNLTINGEAYSAKWDATTETFTVTKGASTTKTAPALTAEEIKVGSDAVFTFTDDEAWRSAVKSVKVGETAITDYTLESGKLTIPAANFTAEGTYNIEVTAEGYDTAKGSVEVKAAGTALGNVTVTAANAETRSNKWVAVPITFTGKKDASFSKMEIKYTRSTAYNSGGPRNVIAGTDLPEGTTISNWSAGYDGTYYTITVTAAEGKTIPVNGELLRIAYSGGSNNGAVDLVSAKFYDAEGNELTADGIEYNDSVITVSSDMLLNYTLEYDSDIATVTTDPEGNAAYGQVKVKAEFKKDGYGISAIDIKSPCGWSGYGYYGYLTDDANAWFNMQKENNCTVVVKFGKKYTVTIDNTKSVGGTISATQTEFVAGSSVRVTSTAEEGYDSNQGEFCYTIEGDSTVYRFSSTSYVTMPEGNITLWKEFKKQYKLTVQQTTGGTATTNRAAVEESKYITPGKDADVFYKADENYSFKSMEYTTDGVNWTTVSNVDKYWSGGTYNTYGRFSMPESDITVRVNFEPYATVKAADGIENGTITFDKTTGQENTYVTITATANEGYRIGSMWYVDEAGTKTVLSKPSLYLPKTGNLTVYAEFVAEDKVDETISSKEELIAFAESVNNGDSKYGKVIELTADIDLEDAEWTPIGKDSSYIFSGTFKGNGHTIKGINVTSGYYAGLFGCTGSGDIENLTIYGNVKGSGLVGGLAGSASGTIRNIKNYCNVEGRTYVGGIVGNFSGTMENCLNYGTITATDLAAAGIIGCAVKADISKCGNNGAINSKATAGGIVGYAFGGTIKLNVSKCYNKGDLTTAGAFGSRVGGIVADGQTYSSTFVITDCYNTGTLSAGSSATKRDGDPCVAGIMSIENGPNGNNCTITITNCYNTGKLEKTGRYTGTTANYGEIFPDKILTGNNWSGMVESDLPEGMVTKVNCYTSTDEINAEKLGDSYKDGCGTMLTWEKVEHAYVVGESKAATCTEEGYTSSIVCSKCGYVYAKGQTLPALGHIEVTDNAVAATCTSTGLTTGRHCTRCGKVTVAQQITDKLAHTVVKDAAVEATCEHSGLTEGSHCAECGTVLSAQKVVERLDHSLELVGYKAATCTEEGYTGAGVCSKCNKIIMKGSVIPMTAHVDVVDKGYDATCEKTGLTDGAHCYVCGTVTKAQEVIAAKGHTKEIIPAVPATTKSTGLTEGVKCSVCGKILTAQKTTPKLIPDGWNKINGDWYYYKNNTVQKGWITDNGRKYYTDPSTGIMVTGFKKIDNKWYYFKTGDSGKMLTGFQKINGSWFYFDTTTGVMATGFTKVGSGTYYFKTGDSGRMLTGWQKIDNKWYYFKTGDSGRMLTGKQTINGKTYTFDANGVWVK